MEKLEVAEISVCGIGNTWSGYVHTEPFCDFHRLYYVFNGEAYFRNSIENISLKKGHLYVLPIYTNYELHQNIQSPFKHMFFHLKFNQVIETSVVEIQIKENTSVLYLIKVLESLIEEKSNNTDERSNNPLAVWEDHACIIKALNLLTEMLELDNKLNIPKDIRLYEVLEYINKNLSQNLSNGKLAKIANVDERHFIRLFKKHYRCTPHSYIQNVRLNRSIAMLEMDMKVKEIYQNIGFENEKSFLRFFKEQKGMPPGEFKKCHFLQQKS